MGAVLLGDPAREERRQQVVALDAVVEGVDEAAQGVGATGPVEERRQPRLVHTHVVILSLVHRLQRCNYVIMITDEARERVAGWFAGRLPAEWQTAPADITIDREEITVRLTIPDVELDADATDVTRAEARAGRAKAFREETRGQRMEIAREAEHRYDAKVSWGVSVGEHARALDPRRRAR